MKQWPKIALLGIAVILAALCIRAATSPVIVSFKDPSAVDPSDGLFVLFSPLRSRGPERVGDRFLEALKRGDCGTGITAVARDYCDREKRGKITRWTLVNREDFSDESISLQYKIFESGYQKGAWRNAWLKLKPVRDGWVPEYYDTYY